MRGTRRAPLGVAIAAVIALAATLSGCGSIGAPAGTGGEPTSGVPRTDFADLPFLDDPSAYTGPSTALLADASIEPIAEQPEQTLPATVSSAELDGARDIVVADTSRVIAMDLSGSLAAAVWGLGFGSTLVGRDQSTTFPGAAELPAVTAGGHSVNAEAIVGLHPTLVLTDGSVGPRDVVEQLRDVGITVVFVSTTSSFAGAEQLARDVAEVFGAPAAGDALAERIHAEVVATTEQIAAIAPDPGLRMVFLYLRGGSGVYYLFGEESGADVLIEALGGIDVAGELGWRGMQPLTDEAIVAADPDLILVMTDGLASVGGVDGLLQELPAVALTTAGQHRRIVDMADGQILSFGPRSAEVLDALARAIYAPDAS